MQKARRHPIKRAPTACRRMVSGTVSIPSSGCFSPFPHGTCTLSVSREYSALPDGPGRFAQDYTCPALLRIPLGCTRLRVRNCHPLRLNFPEHSSRRLHATAWSYYPGDAPLLGESLLFSSPGGTKMFQFPPFASRASARDGSPSGCRVVPFGNPRVKGHLHLTAAYRSLSRPSSPP